jgi:hypothetical protein
MLSEPPKNPKRIVLVQRTIRLKLVLEDPLANHHIDPRRLRDQVPCAVG